MGEKLVQDLLAKVWPELSGEMLDLRNWKISVVNLPLSGLNFSTTII